MEVPDLQLTPGVYALEQNHLYNRLSLNDITFDEDSPPDSEVADTGHFPATMALGDFIESDVFIITNEMRPYVISRVSPRLGEAVMVHTMGIISYADVWIGDDEAFADRVRSLADYIYGPLWDLATKI